MLTANELRSWVFQVIKWDGLLPIFVWYAPLVVKLLLPNQRGAIEIIAVVLPIVAFFVRFFVGSRCISRNRCGIYFRRLQRAALSIGILILVFVDTLMILQHIMPNGALTRTFGDFIIWAVLFLSYLGLLIVAMYPGHSQVCGEASQSGRSTSGSGD